MKRWNLRQAFHRFRPSRDCGRLAARRSCGGRIEFIKPLAVFVSGDLGYSCGVYQATNAGVTVDGRILLVLRTINGKWLIAAHETVVRHQP